MTFITEDFRLYDFHINFRCDPFKDQINFSLTIWLIANDGLVDWTIFLLNKCDNLYWLNEQYDCWCNDLSIYLLCNHILVCTRTCSHRCGRSVVKMRKKRRSHNHDQNRQLVLFFISSSLGIFNPWAWEFPFGILVGYLSLMLSDLNCRQLLFCRTRHAWRGT